VSATETTPVRYYHNIFFRFKVVLLIIAGIDIWWFHARTGPYQSPVGLSYGHIDQHGALVGPLRRTHKLESSSDY